MKTIVIAQLNDRAQPLDRGDLYEDPLDWVLKESGRGQVTGGGTQLAANWEIAFCEVEIELEEVTEEVFGFLQLVLERLGAPKGSKFLAGKDWDEIPFGKLEGLGVYLNGTDLPASTYKTCDVNYVYSEFERLLEGLGRVHSYWEGPTETAFYMHGDSLAQMREALSDYLDSYPLCQKARVVQVA